ncbi:biotin/lipoyl-binding protein [Thioclava sp. JM3]|uniref:biotin/lipoyl-binding protein n=1 Tax=Thioclava sp. JM3 TaxID=1973004 RepID=UPI000B547986|nr:biotin/lipoyl-binding protein [Thioclava sp. JM3]
MSFLSSSPKLRSNRPRAILVTSGLIAALFVILFALPAPYRSVVSGVTWPSEQAQVRVGTSGFVTEVPVATYDAVKPGEVMIKLDDPLLRARLEVLDSQLAGLELQRQAAVRTDRVEAEMIAAEISATREDRNRLAQQLDELSIRAPRAGLAVVPNGEDLQGRFAKRGQVISYVLTEEDTAALRVVVGQDDVDLVRNATGRVDVMPVEYGGQSYPATIVREVPGGIRDLPTPALGLQGGGTVPVDPGDTKGLRTLQRVFEFELEMAPDAALPLLGRRVEVRFSHGTLPIGFQAYRALRQLFLRLYDV